MIGFDELIESLSLNQYPFLVKVALHDLSTSITFALFLLDLILSLGFAARNLSPHTLPTCKFPAEALLGD